jgi:predicted Zn-dependent peptidase
VADAIFAQVVFGDDHPYGQQPIGTEATVRAISREDVQQFYRNHYRPDNSTLIVVGDFRAASLEERIQRAFAGWERAGDRRRTVETPRARSGTTVHVVDKPGTPQVSVRIGHVGTRRSSPDYFPLIVASTVLGGSFTSRLNMNLREAKGFTYGAFASFDMRKSEGPFTARAEIFSAKTDSALAEFMKELNAIRDTIPTPELDKAKSYLELQIPELFETTGDIAGRLVTIALYGLPLDYYAGYARAIGAVTQADARRVAAEYIKPGQVAIVLVGDRRVIEPAVRKLGLAPIEYRTATGARVR